MVENILFYMQAVISILYVNYSSYIVSKGDCMQCQWPRWPSLTIRLRAWSLRTGYKWSPDSSSPMAQDCWYRRMKRKALWSCPIVVLKLASPETFCTCIQSGLLPTYLIWTTDPCTALSEAHQMLATAFVHMYLCVCTVTCTQLVGQLLYLTMFL